MIVYNYELLRHSIVVSMDMGRLKKYVNISKVTSSSCSLNISTISVPMNVKSISIGKRHAWHVPAP